MDKIDKINRIVFPARYKEDARICFFVNAVLVSLVLQGVMKHHVIGAIIPHSAIDAVLFVFLFFTLIFTIYPVLKRSLSFFVVMEGIWVIVYLVSLIQGHANTALLFEMFVWTTCVFVPVLVYVFSIKDKQVFYDSLLKASYIMSLSAFLLFLSPADRDVVYNMLFSYALLIPVLIHFNEWVRTRKKRMLLLSIAETILIVMYGSRGTLLGIGVFFIMRFLYLDMKISGKFVLLFVSVLAGAVVAIFWVPIGEFVLAQLAQRDISNRTLELLFGFHEERGIFYLAGRGEIHDYYIDLINRRPIFGSGVAGGWPERGGHPHNLALDLIVSFGFIAGIAILIAITILFIRSLRTKGAYHDLVLMFFSSAIPVLMVSGSFLRHQHFWVFMGLIMLLPKKGVAVQ